MTLIIDCHGHYTTAPPQHDTWRDAQKAAFKAGEAPPPYPAISDDEIRETIEKNQLKLIRERGADHTIFSPRASTMAHHIGDQAVSEAWSIACNDLIYRVTELFPETFTGVCMLPQSPKADLAASIRELRRCVEQLGFVGCNLNPDPGGGHFTHPALTDESWFPIYEALCELDRAWAGRPGDAPAAGAEDADVPVALAAEASAHEPVGRRSDAQGVGARGAGHVLDVTGAVDGCARRHRLGDGAGRRGRREERRSSERGGDGRATSAQGQITQDPAS